MNPIARAYSFLRDTSGALTVFLVLIFPVLILVGGIATDISLLNGQKRYVQSQADLAAQSAARYLPNVATARAVAREVVAANTLYGAIDLADSDIIFGRFSEEGGFVADANQASPTSATAVRVIVPSPFEPLLLAPVLDDQNLTIRREAIGIQKAVVVFTLRNRLLGLNTRQSILDGVLGPLGLGLTTNVLSYQGLANARVKADDLLGLATLGLAADTLTFDDVLDLPIAIPQLLGGMVNLGSLPASAVPASGLPSDTVTLDEILALSPQLARVTLGNVLPDISVNALDLLTAFAGLAANPAQRLSVSTGLDASPLASVALQLGLIRPPVIAVGVVGDTPAPKAEVAQTDARLTASALNLITLTLNAQLAAAEATALSLNCSASAPTDTLATFSVSTAPVTLGLQVGLLDTTAGLPAPKSVPVSPLAGITQTVSVRLQDFRQPVAISNPITIAGLTTGLNSALTSLKNDLQDQRGKCTGLLGALLCPVTGLLSGVIGTLTGLINGLTSNLINQTAVLNNLVQTLLDLLGIRLAQADLILDDYSCSSALVR